MHSSTRRIQPSYAIFLALFLAAILSVPRDGFSQATVVTVDPTTILQANTQKVGANMGTQTNYDSGMIYKNLLGQNNMGGEGFQDMVIYQIQSGAAPLSTTQFNTNVNNTQYDQVTANYWTGATFTVIQSCGANDQTCSSGGAELGCTGTIASNTIASSSPQGPTYTINPVTNQGSSGCAAAFAAGDVIVLKLTGTNAVYGVGTSTSGGGVISLETNDVCSGCGNSSFLLDTSAGSSTATLTYVFDNESETPPDRFRLFNGTYDFKFMAKQVSGTVTLTPTASRGGGFSCAPAAPTLTGSWVQYSLSCSITDVVGTAGSQITVQFVASGTGVVELDNLDFEQDPSTTDPTNPTIFQDQYVNAWRTAFNTGGPGNGATLRYNVAPDGETLDSWILPTLSRQMVTTGINNYGYGNPDPALQDYLLLCHTLGADPYIILPITLSETDAKNLIDFLYGSSSTTYGAKRIALGGPTDGYQTWFRVLHMPLGNENWNSGFLGQALGWRSGTSSVYQDYTSRANTIFTDMRAVASFVASQTDLIIGVQQYGGGAYASNVATYGHPDSMEFADYNQLNVSDYSTNALLFTPAFAESYVSVNQTTAANPINQWSTAVAGLSLCGPSHTSQCKSTIYEEGNSTFGGTIPQANLNTFPNGGAYGVIMANQFLQDAVTAGTWTQNLFAATGYDNYLNSKNVAIWGVAVDYGGASSSTNASIFGGNVTPRPVMLGLQLDNQAIIGPLIGCNISGTTAAAPYNLAANNNGVNAYNGVPTIYAYCFQSADNANDYAVELINESLTTSYPITFAGGGAPGTNVNVQQLAPKNPTDTNEATVGSWTGQTAAAVSITTLAGQDLSSGITLPPDSVTVLTYATAGATSPSTATPSFSLTPGTYTTSQSVAISDATAGATIYYTTNGTTPTTSSTQYAGPITVSATETLEAIAVATGYTNSAVATAAYTITPTTATPTFSPAGGTYTSSQTVTITDATPGATIYYTTNGSTPTTSSTKYTGPIMVSQTETILAMADPPAYADSAVATAAYTIASVLPTPTFSVAAGTYTTAQTVSISDSSSGATIYYTTNGTTPTTSSTKYTGTAISVSTTETLEAIAVATGYTNSAVATAAYTIASVLPTPTFSVAAGTYTTAQTVSISDSSSGATIYYTTNGTTPTTSSTKYTGTAISVSTTETLKAIAVATGYTNSAVATAAYTIASVLPTPTFSVAAGTYTTAQTVSISDSSSGAAIYYTTNGTTPTTSSTKYAGTAISVSSTETIKAMAVATGYTNSAVATAAYTIASVLPTPTFSVAAGTYTTAQTVSISDSSSGATIYYTTNGTTPTTSSTKYTGIAISVSTTETLEAIAVATGYTNSAVATAAYTISAANSVLPTPTLSLATGNYTTAQTLTITDAASGATIYYTTNDTLPTTSSPKYTGPIKISSSEAVDAVAFAPGYTNSATASGVYLINNVLPTPTILPAGGTYNTSQTVTIREWLNTDVYYTTNGTTPTTSSTRYTGPFTVNSTETIKAIVIASGYTNSAVATAAYTIQAATPSINLGAGFAASQGKMVLNGTAQLNGSGLQLTNGATSQEGSAWYATPVNIQSFTTNFTFQLTNPEANGITFTIQNQGTAALGIFGTGLGYQYIPTSVAVKFDLFNAGGEGPDSTGLYTDGAVPTVPAVNLSSTGINLHSGDTMAVQLVYNGTTLTMTITDTVTQATYTTSFTINIPSTVGGNTAYVGFTGGTGGLTATQEILAWTYGN